LGVRRRGVLHEEGTAFMDKPNAIVAWIKSHSLIVFAGALTTIFGLIVSANNAIPLILKAFDRPDCFTYSNVYRSAHSYFKLEGDVWREYPPNGATHLFEFREIHRTRDNIDLLNLTLRPEIADWKRLLVRLPVCGGTAKISIGVPERWNDLFQVWRV
jgi:hypothetical protein